MKLSIVTAVKNRPEHIAKSAEAISILDLHSEHIIVDWASDPPLKRANLPRDKRIVLVRVNTNFPWWLSGAYNLGFAIAKGDLILKSDADILPGPEFLSSIIQNSTIADFSCGRLTPQEWMIESSLYPSSGLFWAKKHALNNVRGFNPFIFGWGWDDIDLYSRLFSSGYTVLRLKALDTIELKHSNEIRNANILNTKCFFDMPSEKNADVANKLSNLVNSRISALCMQYPCEFPLLSHYLELIHPGNPPSSFINRFSLPADVTEFLLKDCLGLVWANQKLCCSNKLLGYIRWKLKSREYRRFILKTFFGDRILPIAISARP